MPPLIVTLKIDPETFAVLNGLRQQYFPPERNFLPAHITLFHALPGEQESEVRQTLEDLCLQTSILSLQFPRLRSLGRGVAIEVHSPGLIQLRKQLAQGWREWLTPQDRQGYRPHVTLQNKVTAEEARRLYDDLDRTWTSSYGQGEGLLLWQYQGGPWTLVDEFKFIHSITGSEGWGTG
jgi:2'-5' RNA ligase